jgi:hypothetical protein
MIRRGSSGSGGDPEGLLHDPVRESEGLEGLHTPGLDAVRLSQLETTGPALDQAGRDRRELCELCSGDMACGSGSNDEDVDFVRELVGPVNADAGSGLNPRVARHVAVMMKLHESSPSHTVAHWTAGQHCTSAR